MERLTRRTKLGAAEPYIRLSSKSENEEWLRDVVNKLAEYEDLEEQGELQRGRHGKWIAQDETYTRFKCSACGSENHSHRWEYCCKCGAKME